MALTLGTGPLARPSRGILNADLWSVAPERALFLHPLDQRIRGYVGDRAVVDTTSAQMLHETGLLPRWYIPLTDVAADLLVPNEQRTWCPFKGEAVYRDLRLDERQIENVAWSYPEPLDGCPPIADLVSFELARLDAWYEEDERVLGHPRDPFHRVDARRSSRHVVVRAGGELVAESRSPVALFETGLRPQYYLPETDVRTGLLRPSETETVCPYKGVARYEHIDAGGTRIEDAVWCYREPLLEALPVARHRCFGGEQVDVEVSPGHG